MKNFLKLALIASCFLCGCSSSKTANKTTGIIDCYSIEATTGEKVVFSKTYFRSYRPVYEYKSSNGESIYTNNHITYYNRDTEKYDGDAVIYSYKSRYTSDYTEYFYSGFVGWLTYEENYYLDLSNNIIDSEIKYSEYLYSSNPNDAPADNKKAFQCAKKNYYQVYAYAYDIDEKSKDYYYAIKMDLDDKSLDKHSYTKLGDNCTITYKVK